MTNIINPTSISPEMIKNDLFLILSSKPEDATFLDYFSTGAGTTIIELISALGAFYAYNFIIGRRECMLSTATNYSSLLGHANTASYSVSRGNNVKITLTVLPSTTATINKWDILGTYLDYDVVALDSFSLNANVQIDIDVVIGNFLQETITVTKNELTVFSFTQNNTSNDIILLLNTDELPISTDVRDLVNDKYITISNSFGSIDTYYLQNGDYNYSPGDSLILKYIELAELYFSDITLTSFALNNIDNIISKTIISDYTPKELSDSIKIKSRLFRENSGLIRSRSDFHTILLNDSSNLLDANSNDISPGLINITCITLDNYFLTNSELAIFLNYINSKRPDGVASAIITHPYEIRKNVNIDIVRLSNDVLSDTILSEITTLINAYSNKLEQSIDLNDIEYNINQIAGVKKSRIYFDIDVWQSENYYQIYDITNDEENATNKQFVVNNFIYKTDSSEPSWSDDYSVLIDDGRIVWQRVDEYIDLAVYEWTAETEQELYDYIRPVGVTNKIYKCIAIKNYTDSTEPTWNETLGEITFDNEIIWQAIPYLSTVPTWQQDEYFSLGDIVNSTTSIAASFQCIGYRAKSGVSTPSWNTDDDAYTIDDRIQWITKTKLENEISINNLSSMWNQYFKFTEVVTIA